MATNITPKFKKGDVVTVKLVNLGTLVSYYADLTTFEAVYSRARYMFDVLVLLNGKQFIVNLPIVTTGVKSIIRYNLKGTDKLVPEVALYKKTSGKVLEKFNKYLTVNR